MNQNQLSPGSLVVSELVALVDSSIRESIQVKQLLLEEMISKIVDIAEIIISTLKRGNKILVMGNGGSAADAQHMAAELMGRFEKERTSLPIIALTANTSLVTAIANDYGIEQLFSRQIEGLGNPGDLILAMDLIKDNIRVNNIAPGYVATSMTEKSFSNPETHGQRLKHMIVPRWGKPEDFMGAAIYLASEASAYVTGQDIFVDGGWTAKGIT